MSVQEPTMSAPPRTRDQRMEALREANRVRVRRANLKRRVAAGETTYRSLLDDPDCATMTVMEMLRAIPQVGRVKAGRLVARTRISPSKTLGGMTSRQRTELVAELNAHENRRRPRT